MRIRYLFVLLGLIFSLVLAGCQTLVLPTLPPAESAPADAELPPVNSQDEVVAAKEVEGEEAEEETEDKEAKMVTIAVDGAIVGGFDPNDLANLSQHTFQDLEQGAQQKGWLLHEILAQFLDKETRAEDAVIVVQSSTRNMTAQLSNTDIADPANNVILAITNRGTLRLAATLDTLDERQEWVPDVDRIEVQNP